MHDELVSLRKRNYALRTFLFVTPRPHAVGKMHECETNKNKRNVFVHSWLINTHWWLAANAANGFFATNARM